MSKATITYKLTSEFGALEQVRNGKAHNGIDLAMEEGTTLRTIVDGVVEKVFTGEGSIGKGVVIRAEDGTQHIYGHLDEVKVNAGDILEKGDKIGLSGNTGNSTGPHLHFGIKEDGQFVDPEGHIESLRQMTGSNYDPITALDIITDPAGSVNEIIKNNVQEYVEGTVLAALEALKDISLDMIGGIALVGGGILILAQVAGFEKGYRWAGILFAANVMVKYLFGGVSFE